jgi:ferritin-like metal-binding protein YciE
LNESARGKKCPAMQGLVKEGEEVIEDEAGDAALICAAQKVEHYEIATYGSLVAWGRMLGEDEAVSLLEETLQEEKDTDERLTEIAESHINAEETEQDNEEETQEPRRGTKPKASR